MTMKTAQQFIEDHKAWLENRSPKPAGRDYNLTGANLYCATLTGANLTDADLTDAILTDADLTDADLTGAILTGADLTGANLYCAILTGANLYGAKLTGANLHGVPVVEDLDAKIREIVLNTPESLDMGSWHSSCGTTHCRAGWAIHLAGEAGYALESKIGSAAAGSLIYAASTGRVPDFYASTAAALADIKGETR